MMMATPETARAQALVEELFGVPDAAANRAVVVIHAQTAALAWVRDVLGVYPAPRPISEHLQRIANDLKSIDDQRDPAHVLMHSASEVLARYQATAT
jgi:hypothetical protein